MKVSSSFAKLNRFCGCVFICKCAIISKWPFPSTTWRILIKLSFRADRALLTEHNTAQLLCLQIKLKATSAAKVFENSVRAYRKISSWDTVQHKFSAKRIAAGMAAGPDQGNIIDRRQLRSSWLLPWFTYSGKHEGHQEVHQYGLVLHLGRDS